MKANKVYDAIIIGSGVSGSYIAQELCKASWDCLMLEAGKFFNRDTFPRNEMDGNAQLYWNGGLEIDTHAKVAMLRPKVVGGGTIVNQALIDQCDANVLKAWQQESGVDYFNEQDLAPWYKKAEGNVTIQKIPEELWNRNSRIFKEGFQKNGFKYAPLRRAQKDCRYKDKNDCIECLNGCRIDSKQSTPVTSLKRALAAGLQLQPEFEVTHIKKDGPLIHVSGQAADGTQQSFTTKKLVMAGGSMGNTKILFTSGLARDLPMVGNNFYTHPQNMVLARYNEPVNAHKGPFQTLKSDDPNFRAQGFKLENVFAPPASFAMLLPGYGRLHQSLISRINHFACIEVAVRDTQRGKIRVDSNGKLKITKFLNQEDKKRMRLGLDAIDKIFRSTGAAEVIPSRFCIGLHLLGGCNMGQSKRTSVVDPEFHLHGHKNIYLADSSIFPSAPGINPSLTIMALSLKAAEQIIGEAA